MAVNVLGGGLAFDATINGSQFEAQINRMEAMLNSFNREVDRSGRSVDDWAKKLSVAAAGFFSFQAGKAFVQQLVNVRSEFQQLDIAFTTMLKSKEKADQLTKDLIEFAAFTPFGMKEAANAAKQLLAYGSTAETVKNELRMLGDVASGVSQPIGDLVYLYGTLRTQGKAYLMDIRQFAGRGIPIYQELAKVLGVAESQVNDFVSAGKVGFKEIEQAFKNMTAEGSMFGGLMEAQSKTIQGEMERLGDAYDVMLNEIGTSTQGIISLSISSVSSLVENYNKVLDILTVLITTYGAYKAAVIATSVIQNIATATTRGWTVATLLQYRALVIAEAAQKLLNRTMLANPYVAIATVVAALAVTMYKLSDSISAVEKAQNKVNKENREAIETMEAIKNKTSELISVVNDKSSTDFQSNKAYKELQVMYPGLLGNISKENFLKREAIEIQKLLNEENDKRSIDNLSKRYSDAQNNIESLTKRLNDLKQAFALSGNQGGGIARSIRETENQLKSARREVEILGNELSRQQEEYRLSKMTDAEKLKYFEKQRDELIKQRDAMNQLHAKSADLNNIFNNYSLASLNKQLNEVTGKISLLTNPPAVVKRDITAIDKDIEAAKDNQKTATNRAEYLKYQQEINKLEAEKTKITGTLNKTEQKQADERLKALEAITKAEQEAIRKGLQSNEEEIQAAKDKYDELRKEAKNAGLGTGTLTRIDRIEERVTGDLRYNQETEKLKTELDKQKDIFNQYEEYKLAVSKEAADKRFENEKASFDNYGDYLKSKMSEFDGMDVSKMTGQQRERYDSLKKESDEYYKQEKTKADQRFIEALQASETFEQKKLAIEKKYDKLKESLLTLPADEYAERYKVLEQEQKEELKAAQETFFQKTALYKRLGEETLLFTKESLKKEIQAAENLLKTAELSPELRSEIEKQLADLKVRLQVGVDFSNAESLEARKKDLIEALSNPLVKGTEEAKKLQKELAEIQKQIDEIKGKGTGLFNFEGGASVQKTLSGIADIGQQVSGVFSDWASALEGSNDELSYTLGQVGELVNIGTNLAKALASGNPVAQIAGIVSAAASLFTMGKKVKQMNEAARAEQKKFYDEAIKGELTYQALLRQRERDTVTRGKNSYKAIVAELDLLKSQSKDVEAAYNRIFASLQGQEFIQDVGYEHGTWFRKAKTWDIMASLAGADYARMEQLFNEGRLKDQALADFQALKNLREELQQAGIDVEDLQKQLNEMLTGTNVSGLADSLSQLFENGKLHAKDFGQSFEDIMKNAITNSFKYKVMEDAMAPFYKSLSDLMVAGTPTEEQIEILRQQYLNASESLAEQFKNLEKVTGIKLTPDENSSNANSMQGALRAASQESINLLAGHTMGQRIAQLKTNELIEEINTHARASNAMLTRQLQLLSDIKDNTGRTADNTNRLERIETALISIDRKMDSDANKIKAGGI